MMQQSDNIDAGRPFDWGKTSEDYAKYRDIYPDSFYEKIYKLGIGKDGQRILDIGTGTGVLPRAMYKYGANWVGTDISENKIRQARILAKESGMDIEFYTCQAEDIDYPDNAFDVITACQCIYYPDHSVTAPKFARILKKDGRFLILWMAWLPYEDRIACRSEDIILKYNPGWNGSGYKRNPISVPDEYLEYFDVTSRIDYDVMIPFTREGWHGRMRACRGVGASLPETDLRSWEEEHMNMLINEAPEQFEILHYVTMAELTVRK
ncbi:MAG: class I SAM-dependent methyltransferase [Lachnospiraceae bacterium]|nr:class I SAM-dependent methyltransferase [Lachnospiraceae bacterium]